MTACLSCSHQHLKWLTKALSWQKTFFFWSRAVFLLMCCQQALVRWVLKPMWGRGWDRDSLQLDWLKLLWNLSLIMCMFSWNLLCKMGHCWCWVEQMWFGYVILQSFFFFNSTVLALCFSVIPCFSENWYSNCLSYLSSDFYPVCKSMHLSKSACQCPVEAISVVALWSRFLHSRMCHSCITSFPSCSRKYRICHEAAQISTDRVLKIPLWLGWRHR